ncbi:MAG: hypothetical protein K6A34_07325 [Methanobrevibacter sp.]|nr:hypothetical protein [Methanobrevibacter sp.]
MNANDILLKLLYKKLIKNGFSPQDFIIQLEENTCTLSTMNDYATQLLKIKINDFNSEHQGNYIIKIKDLVNENYIAHKIESKYDKDYLNRLTNFDEELFNKEDYADSYVFDLKKYLDADLSKICVDCFGKKGLYNTRYIKQVIHPDANTVQFKLQNDCMPLILHYEYSLFDVYAVIAPIIQKHENADIIFRVEEEELDE